MKARYLIYMILIFSLKVYCQNDDIFKMKKEETSKLLVDTKYTADARIDLSSQKVLTSLSISGKIKLTDSKSLVRVVLVTKAHEYLVYEAYPLMCDALDFSINKVCEETSLLDSEEPIELIVIVRNAEFDLKQIHFSNFNLVNDEKLNLSKLELDSKAKIENYKSSRMNINNAKNDKTWLAGSTEISILPFEKKKGYFGGGFDFMTEGFEYYSDGIFSFESYKPESTNLKSATATTYPSSFDWRNRHGQNWMTPIRLQDPCGACCAFASVAVTEIMTNLYFNSHLNVNLSEQELVSCVIIGNKGCSGCANPVYFLDYIKNNSVKTESCFPYSGTQELCSSPNNCTSPTEKIGFSSIYNTGINESLIKNMLIFKGPIVTSFHLDTWNHVMALIGYNVIQAGDIIDARWYNGQWTYNLVIQPDDPLIGGTYWIFKNSYLTGHAGYQYILMQNVAGNLDIAGAIQTPMTSLIYNESNRVCVDNDGDGYYNWGIGATKPTTCPLCSTNQEDGDDSNPNLGPLDAYGNCTPISAPYPYTQHLITSTETWQSTSSECGNVIVKNGGNLTINGATVTLEGNATFSVEVGGILNINSGTIQ